MKKKIIIVLILGTALLSCCSKDHPEPEETQVESIRDKIRDRPRQKQDSTEVLNIKS